jgi:hypothetical protein
MAAVWGVGSVPTCAVRVNRDGDSSIRGGVELAGESQPVKPLVRHATAATARKTRQGDEAISILRRLYPGTVDVNRSAAGQALRRRELGVAVIAVIGPDGRALIAAKALASVKLVLAALGCCVRRWLGRRKCHCEVPGLFVGTLTLASREQYEECYKRSGHIQRVCGLACSG